MTVERLLELGPAQADAFRGMNEIFQDCEITSGGLKVGHPREDGTTVCWVDIFECYKNTLMSSNGEIFAGVTERGFLLKLLHSYNHIPEDTRITAVKLFEIYSG